MWGACPPRLLYLGDRIPDDLPEPITFRSLAVPDFPRDRTVRDGYDPHPLIEQLSAKPEGSSVDLDECRRWLPFGNEARECLIPVENYCKGVWCGNLWTVGYQNGRIRIWTITPSLKSITPPEVDDIKDSKIHDPPIHALTWTTHYKPALVTGAGRTITVAPPSHSPLWKVGRAVDVPKSQHQGPITDLKISPDNRWVISASTDGSCGLWSLVRREIGHEFVRLYTPPHQDKTKLFDKSYAMNSGVSITGLDWVDEKRFVVGRMSEVWNVWMYCVDAGGEVKCFQGQKGNVLELQCSPRVEGTPHLLASISADCTTGIWDLNNDDDLIVQPLRILNGQHDEEVTTLQWFTSSNFLRLATGGNDARVVIWDPLTGSCLKRFEPGALFKKPVVCMSLAPDMKSLVIGSEDNSVAMLRTQKGFAVWFRSFDMNSEQDDARAHRRIVGAKAQIDETGRLRWLACNFTTGESIVLDLAKTEQCPYP
ncbi:WD40-repeat-containing domain protein [Flagelloscypha sp. PMI_526]|nr:WD40-repeat-containing domain protein [Flagelloscypha sp. PMI_526]